MTANATQTRVVAKAFWQTARRSTTLANGLCLERRRVTGPQQEEGNTLNVVQAGGKDVWRMLPPALGGEGGCWCLTLLKKCVGPCPAAVGQE